MFSDTHFHFHMMVTERGFDGSKELLTMAQNNVFFGLDIGTHCDDLPVRQECIQNAINGLTDEALKNKAKEFIYFSAGIWPAPEAIKNRNEQMIILEENIQKSFNSENKLFKKIVAIGECGLDHHWNPAGADGRCESDFDTELFNGEKELFKMQLQLAKKLNLPVIVHSRDAYEETLECIKDVGYHNGIIHCYSYDLEAAKTFLDYGWYIALGGSTTYTKKSKLQAMQDLIRFIPEDRLLLETDAPYLAPVPLRGQSNTPNYINHTYAYIATTRNIPIEYLCNLVDQNTKSLFSIK